MARCYTREELLELRESPLVCKPPSLPPAEEWMGPIPDPSQNPSQARGKGVNRGKSEGSFSNEATPGRRPPFEPRGKSVNVPEDIVLGPPKTAFTSASGRNAQRPSFAGPDDDETKSERTNFRDRFSREGPRFERDGDKNRDPKPGATMRRSVKEDSDIWSNARQQRASGQEDTERVQRRNGDWEHERERDGAREQRQQRTFESHRRESTRETNGETPDRRTSQLRGRHESSWHRDHDRKEATGDECMDVGRPGDWRDKEKRGKPSEPIWNKGVKLEVEPEWMDERDIKQKTSGPTQDDFQQWKARMKASSGSMEDTVPSRIEHKSNGEEALPGVGANAPKPKVDAPLMLNTAYDGFFQILDKPIKEKDGSGAQQQGTTTTIKATKPSKFTNLFNPKPDPEVPADQPPAPFALPVEDSLNEDKAGFQRILQLLDQQQQPSTRDATAAQNELRQSIQSSPPAQSPRGGENNDPISLFGSRSPQANRVPQANDADYFFQLLTQQSRAEMSPANVGNRRGAPESTPLLPPFSNLVISPQETVQQTPATGPPPGFYQDTMREEMPRDKLNPNTGGDRRVQPPYFDMVPNGQRPTAQQMAMPLGMHRPPGFEHMPPGYLQNPQQPPRQNMGPPPGFQAPRGHNAFPPGLIPNVQNDRGLHYGIRPNGPGMPPPPGFMNLGGPPPGFPSMNFSPDGMPFGGFDFGQGGQGYPPTQGRRQ